MKKLIYIAVALCLSLGMSAQEVTIQNRAQAAKAAGGAELEAFIAELENMQKGNVEKTYLDASNAYAVLGDAAKTNAIRENILKKFPKGVYARTVSLNRLYSIPDGATIEKNYNTWIKNFPQSKLGADISYDYAAYSVAHNYAKENNVAKANEYLKKLQDDSWKATAYTTVANDFTEVGNIDAAEQVIKEICDVCDKMPKATSSRELADRESCYLKYANVLLQKGKTDEAIAQYNKVRSVYRGTGYANIMIDKGQPMHAFVLAEDMMRAGAGTPEVEEMMKRAWQKANGNLEGCEDHISKIKAQRRAEQQQKIAKSMIKEKAPDFTITDGDGKKVSLADMKGKIVVLDFWATWCGPCKRSFPAMKMTVEKYKNDKNVEFLFIHTWERGTADEAIKDAKDYLSQNGYDSFHLLMDTKDPATKTNPAVTAYGVTGIPAKFIIDAQGYIRFQITGFGGSDEEAVDELTQMIEACRNAK